jgi:hypothetical protein
MLRLAFLALPFQMRQHSRLTSSTIIALACSLLGSAGRPFAACVDAHRYVKPIDYG